MHIDSYIDFPLDHAEGYMRLIFSELDDFFVPCLSMGLCSAGKTYGLQYIGLSLAIVPVQNVHSLTEFKELCFIIPKIF